MRNLIIIFFLSAFWSNTITSQAPNPALIGYWHNWNTTSAQYIQLDQIDTNYNIVDVSFAIPQTGTDYKMEFIPAQATSATLISQIQTLQSNGKKVIITETGWPSEGGSEGGAVSSAVNAMKYFINTQVWASKNNIESFYFSSFDESWKVGAEGDVGAYWGLWGKNEHLKF